jgi:hypothetical protein
MRSAPKLGPEAKSATRDSTQPIANRSTCIVEGDPWPPKHGFDARVRLCSITTRRSGRQAAEMGRSRSDKPRGAMSAIDHLVRQFHYGDPSRRDAIESTNDTRCILVMPHETDSASIGSREYRFATASSFSRRVTKWANALDRRRSVIDEVPRMAPIRSSCSWTNDGNRTFGAANDAGTPGFKPQGRTHAPREVRNGNSRDTSLCSRIPARTYLPWRDPVQPRVSEWRTPRVVHGRRRGARKPRDLWCSSNSLPEACRKHAPARLISSRDLR